MRPQQVNLLVLALSELVSRLLVLLLNLRVTVLNAFKLLLELPDLLLLLHELNVAVLDRLGVAFLLFEVDAELPEILLDSILEYLNLRPLLLVVHRLYLQHLFGLLAALVVGLHDLLDLALLKQLLAHLLILGPQAIEFTLLVFMLLLLLLPFHLDFVNLCHEELVVRLE